MKQLSYMQEFFLCAVNKKGKIPSSRAGYISACLIAGGMAELLNCGSIVRNEKDKLTAEKPLADNLPYLKPLYEKIAALKKPKSAKGIAEMFIAGFSRKPLDELCLAFGLSLSEAGYADALTKQGRKKVKIKYAPKEEAVKRVIEKVRAEVLEEGEMTAETLCLTAMLDKCGIVRNYFSKVEAKDLKKRVKEARESELYASVKEICDSVDAMYAAIIVVMAAGATSR
ncbi:MAG: GPP34 family phosphoprotein [Oscillospiraceae bacterium]|nr:GPP34 family phosphoprotein [Oscillospiraceae bacterium]